MQKQFNNLVKSIIIYGFGNVSVKLVGLVLLRMYTNPHLLSPDEYGALGMMDISAQVLISVFSLSLYAAYGRWYWDKDHIDNRKKIFFTCFSTLLVLSAFIAVSGIFAARPLSMVLFDRDDFANAMMLMMLGASMQPLIDFTLTQMRLEEKPLFYITINIVRLAVTLGATIWFLKYANRGLSGIYEAQIIGNMLFLVIASGYIYRSSVFSFSGPIVKEMIRFSLPLSLAAFSNVLLAVFDRFVLNYNSIDNKSTLLNVGIYTQGFKIANTTKVFIISSVQLALAPAIFKIMNHPDHKMIYSKIMTWFTIIVVYFSLFLSLFGLEVTKFFTTGTIYWDAYKIIPILALGIIFGMLKDVSITGLQITKRTRIIGIIIAGIAIFNLGLNMLMVPLWGIYGAASSSLVSQVIFFSILYIYAQKHYPIPYRLDRVGLILVSGILLFIAGSLVNDLSLGIRVAVKITALLLFPMLLFIFRIITREEIGMALSLFKSIKGFFTNGKKEEIPQPVAGIDEV
jgi:O-antigen/teichoic acid export membrane protein